MKNLKNTVDTVVLYHNLCPDGFAGAWVARKKFGTRAKYIGLNRGAVPPKGLNEKTVYIIDFDFRPPQMKKLLQEAKKVIALDHHVSARKSTRMATSFVYDLERSGSGIAWNYFYPGKSMPRLIRHIQDIDLWKFKLPKTREVASYLDAEKFDFGLWDKVARDLENPKKRRAIIEKGAAIAQYQRKIVERALKVAELVEFRGIKALATNFPLLTSEIGNELLKFKKPLAIIWSRKDGRIVVSMRSSRGLDVSKIAVRFGGGGHPRAAGFSFSANKPFPWKTIKYQKSNIKNQK